MRPHARNTEGLETEEKVANGVQTRNGARRGVFADTKATRRTAEVGRGRHRMTAAERNCLARRPRGMPARARLKTADDQRHQVTKLKFNFLSGSRFRGDSDSSPDLRAPVCVGSCAVCPRVPPCARGGVTAGERVNAVRGKRRTWPYRRTARTCTDSISQKGLPGNNERTNSKPCLYRYCPPCSAAWCHGSRPCAQRC